MRAGWPNIVLLGKENTEQKEDPYWLLKGTVSADSLYLSFSSKIKIDYIFFFFLLNPNRNLP
jgi:hypothetical protein